MSGKRLWFAVGLALLLAACGGGAPPQDLALAGVSPSSPSVVQGGSVTLTLTFTSQNGFQGTVSLSVTKDGQEPSWLTLSPTSATLNVPKGGQVQETLQVGVASNAPTGPHSLKLKASYGSKTAERDLTLTVTAPPPLPDFTLSLNPTSLSVQQGSQAQTTLTLTPQNGFTGTVALSLVAGQDPVPQGLTLSPQGVQVTGSGPVNQTLTLSTTTSTPTGQYRIKVRGTAGSLTREADLTVTVSPNYTGAYVYQVSADGSVLVGGVSVGGYRKPMVWRINAASLSPGFYWLSAIAQQSTVLDTGVPSAPYGNVLGVTADGQVACGYGSVSTNASSGDRALAWNLTTNQAIPLPDDPSGGNTAYACAKSGSDVYIVGRVYPNFPTPTIWKNYTIWHQNTSVAYGIFHDITPDASRASVQLTYRGWVYDLNNNQYTQLISSIGGAYWSRISPDGQAVAFSDSNSYPAAKVWYGGNVYSASMSIGAVRVQGGVAYVFGGSSDGLRAVRWRSDTQALEDLNTVFASVLPSGVTLKTVSAVSLDNRVIVGIARNPNTNQDEPFVLVGDPFQAAP
ncbi:hypothetical protein TthHB5008_05810 [Thermus thermophilus]|uniref:COG1470 family protein n=1 Tax=Thermus thermophilus TaxID=274 RepID=UPI0019507C01|nr:hypothetical protein [Thermus thermophilus]BCP97480.1 hypothetical protein TthHB5002_05830 [Thermus thermophilus]BCP99810.1 hypothetical protein TthHB5008_05810 [Thermus thermophilus]